MSSRSRSFKVFFDPTGRRWHRLKRSGTAVVSIALLGTVLLWPRAGSLPADSLVAPSALAQEDIPRWPPVVGSGPLARLTRVTGSDQTPRRLVGLYNRAPIRTLTPAESRKVGDAQFAVERYGYGEDVQRTIALTFDDGPDPRFTPRLLDLLSQEQVPATFFVTGKQAARHPELIRRIAREGHALGNHTFGHADVSEGEPDDARREIATTDRILRATGGGATVMFRPPYGGNDRRSLQNDALALARAQQLGYAIASYDFDTNDWQYGGRRTPDAAMPMPELDGRNLTLLLHDAGGNRRATIEYLHRLIPAARDAGYTFHSLPQVAPAVAAPAGSADASLLDHLTLHGARALVVWPGRLVHGLFALAIVSVVLVGLAGVMLAAGRQLLHRRRLRDARDTPLVLVSVLIAAYNEADVIGATLQALRRSRFPVLQIVVVDDGSTDDTAQVVRELQRLDGRICLVQQANSGKAAALNRGIMAAQGDVIVTLDADTQVTPHTVGNLVRHFDGDDGTLGAVAGVVKVGNLHNVLTRWQAVEYISQIGVERAAQDALGAIMIVPGACAAWRRAAVIEAGGYSDVTLAEDFDLSMTLQGLGYRITQDDRAIAYTEAPETLRALLKQRTRWMFGSLQSMWKHRHLMGNPRYGWLGLVVLPFTALSIIVPVVFLPFVYVLAAVLAAQGQAAAVLAYVALFTGAHFVVATMGVLLMREGPAHLLMIPFHRLLYEPLRVYLLYTSIYNALRGTALGWNKLARTGGVELQRVGVPVPEQAQA